MKQSLRFFCRPQDPFSAGKNHSIALVESLRAAKVSFNRGEEDVRGELFEFYERKYLIQSLRGCPKVEKHRRPPKSQKDFAEIADPFEPQPGLPPSRVHLKSFLRKAKSESTEVNVMASNATGSSASNASGGRAGQLSPASVQGADRSAFMTLWNSRCETSLITITGFDRRSIEYLLGVPTADITDVDAFQQNKFERLFNRYALKPQDGMYRLLVRPAPREMTALQCLAMVLAWTRMQGSTSMLAISFGVSSQVCYSYLRFGRALLTRVLVYDERAEIRLPTPEETVQFKAAVRLKYPALEDVCLVADGLKIPVDRPGDSISRSRFYNGWTNAYYTSNVLVFAPNGKIVACAVNFPGAAHDSLVADWGGIYDKLAFLHERDGARCAVDSAFCQRRFPAFLVKSAQEYLATTEAEVDVAIQATKLRQAAEWGMGSLKSSFPRLKDGLHHDTFRERKLQMYLFMHLFNLRADLQLHTNQIRTVFMPSEGHGLDT